VGLETTDMGAQGVTPSTSDLNPGATIFKKGEGGEAERETVKGVNGNNNHKKNHTKGIQPAKKRPWSPRASLSYRRRSKGRGEEEKGAWKKTGHKQNILETKLEIDQVLRFLARWKDGEVPKEDSEKSEQGEFSKKRTERGA